MKTLITVQFGSHLYGTNTPESDQDFKSVVVPTGRDILLGKVPNTSWNTTTKQDDTKKNTSKDTDTEVYTLAGFMRLLAEGQTAALEVLFAPENMIIEMDPEWNILRENAHRLVHRDTAAFFGYAKQQAAKYGLKGSRISAIRRTMEYLSQFSDDTKLLKLYESMSEPYNLKTFVEKNADLKLDETEPLIKFSSSRYKRNGVQCEEQFLEVCQRKIPLHNNVKHTKQVFQRVWDEYGKRARQAENNEGVDWKALSHAVRVGKQAIELLDTGKISLPRPEAQFLTDIKLGKYPYKEVAAIIESLFEEIKQVQLESKLRDSFDTALGEDILLYFYDHAILEAGMNEELANPRNIWP